MCHNHVQAVWFSASADLAVDATRDFCDIGAYKSVPPSCGSLPASLSRVPHSQAAVYCKAREALGAAQV